VNVLGLVFEERGSAARNSSTNTDCKCVPAEALRLAKGAQAVVLDGLRPKEHPTPHEYREGHRDRRTRLARR